jgi:3-oxoacyl-[acyl-carrier protein] reductase
MLLERKNAVIYGGGGTIAGAVARAFAREGASVHLAGRTLAKLEQVAGEIRQDGGTATVAQVDALDERAVDAHADELVRDHGTLDISMNLISTGDVQGTPLVEMELADFERPIHNAMRSSYVTARAAGRHMIRQGSGVILVFGGEGDPIRDYNIGGFQISLTAVEALRKQLASELGRHGIPGCVAADRRCDRLDPRRLRGSRRARRVAGRDDPAGSWSDAGRRRQRRCLRGLRGGAHDHRIGDQHYLRSHHHLSASTSDTTASGQVGRGRPPGSWGSPDSCRREE